MKNKIIIVLTMFLINSCTSYEHFKRITEEFDIPSQVYRSDFTQTWQAVIQVMKKYDIAYQNQESGQIKTRWMDNTLQVNFADSFGNQDAVKAAELKLVVNVAQGFSYGRKVAKVTVFKRQRVENDFLQGWKESPTDGILEKTLLYRIGRIIKNDNELRKIDQSKEKEQLESF